MMAAAGSKTMESSGLYVCAIVAARGSFGELTEYVNNLACEAQLIGRGDFSAVVMTSTEDPLVNRDRKDLMRQLLVHQRLVESIMATTPVLPVKFATLAPDRESVERGLERGHEKFAAAFEGLSGKNQFEIVVSWDVAKVFEEIAKEPAVTKLKADLANEAGKAAPETLEQLGKLVKQALDRRRAVIGKELLGALSRVGVDSVVNPIMDDNMILNLALLVDAEPADALDQCLDALDNAYHGALTFRCVGPLPPHSFATVEITFLEPEKIKHACNILELEAARSSDEVRSAYRRLVKQSHPDVALDQSNSAGISVLKDAYSTLLSFVDAGGPVVVSVQRQEAAYSVGAAAGSG